jgi:hypothetical protein
MDPCLLLHTVHHLTCMTAASLVPGLDLATKSNPRNPDPTVWVGRGGRSIDEMAASHIGLVYLSEEDFKARVAERAAAKGQAPTSTQQQ